MTIEPKKQPAPCPLSPTKIKHHEYQSIIYFCAVAVRYCLRRELAFEQPKDQVFLNRLTPLLDNDRRGEIIEIHLRNGDVSYIAAATNIIRKTIYSLSAERSGTEPEMTCKRRGAFVNRDMALELPNLPATSH